MAFFKPLLKSKKVCEGVKIYKNDDKKCKALSVTCGSKDEKDQSKRAKMGLQILSKSILP